jgi:hypothetical protein
MRDRYGLVYHPLIAFGGKSHQVRGKMKGTGGAVLLDGGRGGQSSYSSIDDYISTTRSNPVATIQNMGGMGLARSMVMPMKKEQMNEKLKNMMVKPKSKNIKFNL